MPTHEPDRRDTGPSLEQILGLIAPGMLDVVVAPRGTNVPVADVVLHDAGEERDDGTWAASGLILLAVGVEVASPEAVDVLRGADRAGAAAVVMRRGGRGPRAALVEAAGQGRTALLTRRPGQGWTEVLGQLRTALAHSAPAGAGGTAGVAGLRLGDLSGLANTVADLVGGAITIEDPQSRVLAYSRMDHEPDPMRRLTILGQEVPRWRVVELRESGFFQALWSTDGVVRLPADARYAERLAIAVRHGTEVLGSIWAAADGRPLAEDAAAALRTAARAAVPHLSHHQTWGRAAARAREGAVHALLKGDVRAAHEAGVTADRPYAVVVAEAYDGRGSGADEAPGAAGQRVLDVLALQAAAYRSGCVTARSGRQLYVLVPAGDGETDPARTLLATARSVPRSVVLAGAGPVAAGLSGLPASRETAELVVRVLRERAARLPAGDVVSAVAAHGEVVPETTVLRLLDRVEPLWDSLSGPVHAMVEHDRVHGSAYGDSVTAYLDASCDTGTAARRLNVHPNTLRYRLRRARELFGVDPADPAVRLLAEIGLRLAARRPRGTDSRSR
ncbi:helix-turn-helix domain-containing protein [Streptomyces sp. NBC_01591]|uniref:helix-turn-helix domain-containing protein n=1 Tax=Streptomyces sp. NBC_01591 TaxID=2975888 RepID=UPI002DD8AD98|nr:helix-turn-helix domain-containing protein [Streptomyces sp. NBC_01591]WSD69708.1 helix-turn-helix domain-containing protein [Streptomyces sp. NBC_01591]